MIPENGPRVSVRPFALPGVTEEEYTAAERPAFHVAGTTDRTSSAHDSISRVSPYLRDYGITRVANLTHLDRVGVPVHTALKPMGTTLSNGSGKGLTMEASKISAIMEAIEQTHWENDQFDRVEATQADLTAQGLVVTDGSELPLFKLSLWNERLPLEWTTGHDLVTGEEVWTPAELVQANLRSRLAISTFVTSSNGLASGNNVFEAILSALTELVERDAIAMYRANGNRETYDPAIDLDLLSARYGEPFHGLREQIERADLRLFVFDCTNEIGIPTYKAFVHDLAVSRAGAFGGYGTSLDPAIALCRAVTEAMQSRGLVIAGSRDDQFGSVRDASLMHSNHYEAPPPGSKPLPLLEDASTGSIVDDVAVVAAKLREAGMDRIVVLRHTEPGDPVQVVRVIVPKLEGYRFEQYTPGPRARAAEARFARAQQTGGVS
jgi:YcaO-like protein with predicted kinase domain